MVMTPDWPGDEHHKTLEGDIERLDMTPTDGTKTLIAGDPREAAPHPGRTFNTGATRDTDEGKLDWEGFISPIWMQEFAKYMHTHRTQVDGDLRDADNWQKGMPRRQYMKSLIRHTWNLWLLWRGIGTKEQMLELLCAIQFNVQGLGYELLIGRDVDDS